MFSRALHQLHVFPARALHLLHVFPRFAPITSVFSQSRLTLVACFVHFYHVAFLLQFLKFQGQFSPCNSIAQILITFQLNKPACLATSNRKLYIYRVQRTNFHSRIAFICRPFNVTLKDVIRCLKTAPLETIFNQGPKEDGAGIIQALEQCSNRSPDKHPTPDSDISVLKSLVPCMSRLDRGNEALNSFRNVFNI